MKKKALTKIELIASRATVVSDQLDWLNSLLNDPSEPLTQEELIAMNSELKEVSQRAEDLLGDVEDQFAVLERRRMTA